MLRSRSLRSAAVCLAATGAMTLALVGYFHTIVAALGLPTLPIIDAHRETIDERSFRFELPQLDTPAIIRLGHVPTPLGATTVVENARYLVVPLYEDLGPLRLVVIDKLSGKQREVVMAGAKFAYGLYFDRHDDHQLWIATSEQAALYELQLSAGEPRLRWQSTDDSHIFSIDQAADGTIYLGTYPHHQCLVFRPDGSWRPQRIEVRHPAIARATYLYRIVVTDEAYYLSYSAPAVVIRYDRRTATPTEFARSSTPFIELVHHQDRIWAQLDQVWHGYDRSGTALPSETRFDGGPTATIAARGLSAEIRSGEKSYEISLRPRAGGMGITALDPGAQPRLIGATYWNTWLFEIDTAAYQVRGIGALPGGSGEFFYSFPDTDSRQLIPSYQGLLYAYDPPRAPLAPATNALHRLAAAPQIHYGLASARLSPTTLVYTTFPNYHQPSGSLVRLETVARGELREPQIVERIGDGLTLGHLARCNERLFGGTLDVAGAAIARSQGQPPLLVELDDHGQIIQRWQLDHRADDVVGLLALDDRQLLCATRRGLYRFVPERSELRPIGAVTWFKRLWDSHLRKLLKYGQQVLIVSRTLLLAYDPATDHVRAIAKLPIDGTQAAIGADGGLYLANREQLWVIPRQTLEQWGLNAALDEPAEEQNELPSD